MPAVMGLLEAATYRRLRSAADLFRARSASKPRSFRHDAAWGGFATVRPAEPLSKPRGVLLEAARLLSRDGSAHGRQVAALLADTRAPDLA